MFVNFYPGYIDSTFEKRASKVRETYRSKLDSLKDKFGKENCVFTGDTLFLGDVGIPDVAQRYMGVSKKELAGILYDSVNNKIKPLSDEILVYPGHGAGSACGKNMMKETVDTLSNQKNINYAINQFKLSKYFKIK